jgi:hypothetical protein
LAKAAASSGLEKQNTTKSLERVTVKGADFVDLLAHVHVIFDSIPASILAYECCKIRTSG